MWNLIFWIICLLINLGLLAIVFYSLLCLTDLEVDQMDPFVATANINRWILLEFALQAALSILLLFTGHWILFLVAVPLTCYHAMLFSLSLCSVRVGENRGVGSPDALYNNH
ncbi:protein cornichon [Populus alba x Populus x berolinensis]|uniref:Protein cornichon n=1 Tax=Populus alba x Populus x berolinensis TaxID=444605 RepID=A0AAD6LJ15_9ROSI|nr:protein cornichon [Populus alba x Populus x berolinensis]